MVVEWEFGVNEDGHLILTAYCTDTKIALRLDDDDLEFLSNLQTEADAMEDPRRDR